MYIAYIRQLILFISVKISCPITGLDGPLGLEEVEAVRICRQSSHEGGKVVSPTHWSPLPAGHIPGTNVC